VGEVPAGSFAKRNCRGEIAARPLSYTGTAQHINTNPSGCPESIP